MLYLHQSIKYVSMNEMNEMKDNKYHTVWTIPKSNRKTKNTTLSEQF